MSVVHQPITLLDQVSILLRECLPFFLILFCSYVKHITDTDTRRKHFRYCITLVYLMYVSMARW